MDLSAFTVYPRRKRSGTKIADRHIVTNGSDAAVRGWQMRRRGSLSEVAHGHILGHVVEFVATYPHPSWRPRANRSRRFRWNGDSWRLGLGIRRRFCGIRVQGLRNLIRSL